MESTDLSTLLPIIGGVIVVVLLVVYLLSKKKVARYSEKGSAPDERNVSEFGVPAKTLYTSTKVVSLTHYIEVSDEADTLLYESNSEFFSLRDKTDITRADGSMVAHFEKQLISLRQRHFVTMANGTEFELSTELLHLIKDIINIEGLGWQIQGNILQMNFNLFDADGKIIAAIGQKPFSIHDKYSVDIYQPELEETIVVILICLQHMIRDREVAASSSSSSSSSTSTTAST